MFDNITLINNSLTTSQKLQVVTKNSLQCFVNEASGIKIYDNQNKKNLTGGILIKIYDNKLKIEGSVHKFYNYLQFGNLENYTVFTMQNFTDAINKLFEKYGLFGIDFLLVNYEIGINVYLETGEPLEYLKKAISIGNLDGTQRKLYPNPKYKNERFLTTQMHKDNTVIFRMYDKNFERLDKGKKTIIQNCIRIETLRTRQKNIPFFDFIKPANLLLIQNKFFSEWNKLNFDKEIFAPAGTHQNKKELAKKIILDGSTTVLQDLEERKNQITPKIFRTSKEFVKNWENLKFNFSLIDCEIMPIWANSYLIAIQQYTKINNKN